MQQITELIASVLRSALGPSWAPKVGGILSLAGGGFLAVSKLLNQKPLEESDWAVLTLLVGIVVSAFTARANKVTSEQATGKA